VPEAAGPGLAPAHRLLLGVALTIRRDPVAIRVVRFWPAVERWWQHAALEPPEAASGRPDKRPATAPAARSPGAPLPSQPRAAPAARPSWLRAEMPIDRRDPPESPEHQHPGSGTPPLTVADTSSPDPGTWTSLAGIFYLLNVGVFLGLYGDFTSPRDTGISLDPWDFAALIGRRLLRRGDPRDPVWNQLAELAGHDRPGAGFRAPRCWRVPPAWLEPFEPARGPWRSTITGDRLRVLHPAGFVALDVFAADDPPGQLQRELARIGVTRRPRPLRTSQTTHTARGTARWLGWVADYVRARLRIALGTRTADAAVTTVLERPGAVHVSPTRVDVHFSLDDLPVAIRLAGLDRSPGWIPAGGRHLEFHFA
jgi:hypothetical protein